MQVPSSGHGAIICSGSWVGWGGGGTRGKKTTHKLLTSYWEILLGAGTETFKHFPREAESEWKKRGGGRGKFICALTSGKGSCLVKNSDPAAEGVIHICNKRDTIPEKPNRWNYFEKSFHFHSTQYLVQCRSFLLSTDSYCSTLCLTFFLLLLRLWSS